MDSKDPASDWRVSAGLSGSTPRLSDGGPSRDRSLWSLQQRPLGGGGGGGSAWARSTTTRDSPVLSGLNDGLSSLFSVVEHSGSMESLWRGDTAGRTGLYYDLKSFKDNQTTTYYLCISCPVFFVE